MARALAASGVSIFASASMYSRRAGGAESLRSPIANPFTAIGIVDARMFSRACCVAVAAQPTAPTLQLLEPLLLGGILLPLVFGQFDFLRQLPLAFVALIARAGS